MKLVSFHFVSKYGKTKCENVKTYKSPTIFLSAFGIEVSFVETFKSRTVFLVCFWNLGFGDNEPHGGGYFCPP